jgi:alcohol dehydrogenase YqhD (iron-dependent ADH family)
MENFIAYNPVQIYFGKGVISKLGSNVQKYGKNVLLIYGGGSVKKNGSYQDVINQLQQINAHIVEYSGIKPNPVLLDVESAIKLAIENQVEVIVAIGGGSVIDSAKLISVSVPENLDPWSVMKSKSFPKKALPLITVLTLAATGTEMNAAAVIQNPSTKQKIGMAHPLMFPKISFLDPVYTSTVSPEYTAYGIVDLIAHTFEAFFADGGSSLSDRFVQSIVQEAFRYASLVLEDPQNYEYRANILLQSTCALNGITGYGRSGGGDWGVHDLGHTLSFLYDTPHGASLSIVYPAWLKLHANRIPNRISTLAKLLFNTPNIDEFLLKLSAFFKQINSPVKLSEINIHKDKKTEIVDLMKANKVSGQFHKLNEEDYNQLVDLML